MEFPIYLVGYMGAGKTTIGQILADRLGWHFVDLDAAFEELNGTSVGDFILAHGVEKFRKKEKDCVEDLSELPIQKVIYATGGGYPCWEDNMDCLLELGTTIYIRWHNEHLAERIEISGCENRPILQGKHGQELVDFIAWQMSGREPFYAKAHYIIDAPLSGADKMITPQDDIEVAEYIYTLIQNDN